MTGSTVSLEQFGGLVEKERVDAQQQSPADQVSGASSAKTDAIESGIVRAADTGAGSNNSGLVAELEARIHEELDKLTQLRRCAEADLDDVKADLLRGSLLEVAGAFRKILPTLTKSRMPEEVAAAVAALAKTGAPRELKLNVNADEHTLLVDLLCRYHPDATIDVLSDPSLSPGQAKMTWVGGGADFDMNGLQDLACRHLEAQLQRYSEKAEQHE